MRSGIVGPATYDAGATVPELVEMLPEPAFPAGSIFSYEGMNYVLLGSIIEHVTGRSLWEVLRSDVLHRPGLGGLRYPVATRWPQTDRWSSPTPPRWRAGATSSTAVRSCPPRCYAR